MLELWCMSSCKSFATRFALHTSYGCPCRRINELAGKVKNRWGIRYNFKSDFKMSRRKERVNFEKETGNDKLSKRIANRHKRDKLFANYFPPVLIEIFFSKILINLNYNLKIWLFYNLIKKLWIYKNIKYFPIYIN